MRRFVIAAVVAVASVIATATPARAAAISFSNATANVGQTFSVDVLLTGINPGIASFSFDFVFNSLVLDLVGISEGNIFGGFGSFDTTQGAVKGSVDASIYPFESALSPATLARLTFKAVGSGSAGLALKNTELTGVNWWMGFIPVTYGVEHTVSNGTVTVGAGQPTPVPEPGTMTLFGLGAYALARRIRRRTGSEIIAA
jgi:hypothetical protein